MREINPNHPVTAAMRTEWHKLLALALRKLGVDRVVLTESDLATALNEPAGINVVCHAHADCIEIRLVTDAEATRNRRAGRWAARMSTGTTDDPQDPRLGRGVDQAPRPQNEVYLVLSDAERAKGFVRPLRDTYRHVTCGQKTTMGSAIAETYARDPSFYGATYCCTCRMHRPLAEFEWLDGGTVGS